MDSLTQIVLGAAVGELLLGRQMGNKAMLLGAIGGTMPDLDVIYNFFDSDPARQLEVHRAYSHSMFTHIVAAFPLAWISNHWSAHAISSKRWYAFWFLVLFTHALLDCCTTYGTQLLLPFTNYQVAFNNISVIDPIYTLPFMLLLLGAMFFRRDHPFRKKLTHAGVIVSSVYMLLTFAGKWVVHNKFEKSLSENKIDYAEMSSTPTILNSILWSSIAYNHDTLYVAEYSFLKPEEPIEWIPFARNLHLESKYDSKALGTVKWFSDGNYFLEPVGQDSVIFYTVKFGRMRFDSSKAREAFFFHWMFFIEDHEVRYEEIRRDDWKFNEALKMLLDRIGI